MHIVFCLDQFAGVETKRGSNRMENPLTPKTPGEGLPHSSRRRRRKEKTNKQTDRSPSAFKAISRDRTSQARTSHASEPELNNVHVHVESHGKRGEKG